MLFAPALGRFGTLQPYQKMRPLLERLASESSDDSHCRIDRPDGVGGMFYGHFVISSK